MRRLPVMTDDRVSDGAREAFDFINEIKFTLKLGAPLALGELGWMSTYIVDALMIGRLHNSALPISASSLGGTIFYAIVLGAIYLMNGLETLVAQAYGRNERNECVHLLAQAFWFVSILTPLVMVLTLLSLRALPFLGTPNDIAAETSRYLKPLIWSTGPLMGYMALRRFLQSIDSVLWVTMSLITAALVNWFGDWVFLFGHFGIQSMGVAGSAWATVIVRIYMFMLLVAGTLLAIRRLRQPLRLSMFRPDIRRLRRLLAIGWPSGLEMMTDLGVSTYMSVVCSRLGATLLAAHQVVLDLNAFVYQIPAGLSYATVVRVGQSAGRHNLIQIRRAASASLWLGLSFIGIAAPLFAFFSHFWASLYTDSEAVVLAAMPIFTICGVLLIGDTVFAILASAFTGLGDTRTPMIVSVVWNWMLGMPLGYALAFQHGLDLRGVWYGRAVAAIGGAITLWLSWKRRLSQKALEPTQLPSV